MEDVDSPREHDGPGRGVRDGPESIRSRLEQFSLNQDVLREGDGGRRVGAGVPDLVPGHQLAEELAAAGDGAVIDDGDGIEAHDLAHPAVLAEGDPFLSGEEGGRGEQGDWEKTHTFSLSGLPTIFMPPHVSRRSVIRQAPSRTVA